MSNHIKSYRIISLYSLPFAFCGAICCSLFHTSMWYCIITTMHSHRFSTHPPFHLFLIHNWRQLVAGVCGWQSYALCLVALDLRTHSLPPILLGGYSGWESRKGRTWAKIGHVATQFPPTHHLLSWHCYINNQACFFQQCTRTVSQPTHPSISF